MTRVVILIACWALFVSTAVGQKPDDAVAAELKALVGKYRVKKAEVGGKDVTEDFKEMKFEVTGPGKYVVQFGEEKDDATFTVDVTKKPKEMDIKSTGGPLKGKTVKIIYKLEDDTITVCFDHDKPENRPMKFETKEGTMLVLIVYKREKM
jgi:uncharacterized protein (TIGR03067 family)